MKNQNLIKRNVLSFVCATTLAVVALLSVQPIAPTSTTLFASALLHTFHLVTTALMLFWYLRYEGCGKSKGSYRQRAQKTGGISDIRLGGIGLCAISNCLACAV